MPRQMPVEAQAVEPSARLIFEETHELHAFWVSEANALNEYGIFLFRLAFALEQAPASFRVRVSADNRYQLFVNGQRVARGPARGSLEHWRYEALDIAEFLQGGANVLSAVVWNHGERGPLAQISLRTAFLVDGATEHERSLVGTGIAPWKVFRDPSRTALPVPGNIGRKFMVVGQGDCMDAKLHPWGFAELGFDDGSWEAAVRVGPALSHANPGADNTWMLEARRIPLMEERVVRLAKVRQTVGLAPPPDFSRAFEPCTVLPHSRVTFLLDQTYLVTAYPRLVVSGGRGGRVRLEYAESFWSEPELKTKPHRDQVEGHVFAGMADEFLPDGGHARVFEPVWWRTYRYFRVSIETEEQGLTLLDLFGLSTSYPFQRRAQFSASVSYESREDAVDLAHDLDAILDVGWRTARLCAHETYLDCPYYEQLQYVGDTRVQALISYYTAGDDRLARNALSHFDDSRIGDGLPSSRYPVRVRQYIPQFSLLWIGMLHDFMWYRDDPVFLRKFLPGMRQALDFFERYLTEEGRLLKLPYWAYFDWVVGWRGGVPPSYNVSPTWAGKRTFAFEEEDPRGASSLFDLALVMALDWATSIEQWVGLVPQAERFAGLANKIRQHAKARYYDESRQLFSDNAGHQSFSQHANILAVLTGVVEGQEARNLMMRLLAPGTGLHRVSPHWQFYLAAALRRADLSEQYLLELDLWRRMISRGLTTWEEVEEPTRSDCHAWGSSPNIELFRTVLGIDSMAPGFRRVRVAPALGPLSGGRGSVPHPKGEVQVSFQREPKVLRSTIVLPPETSGELLWRGHRVPLGAGENRHELPHLA